MIKLIIISSVMLGNGLINTLIDKLPIELHLPGYNYCGPGTKLKQRLLRGDKGVNKLDEACKYHDIAYSNYSDLNNRNKADLELLNMAKQRLRSNDAGRGEKLASWIVSKIMKAKVKTGMGVKNFKSLITKIRCHLKKIKPCNEKSAIKIAYAAAKKYFLKNKVRLPRVIPIPKTGGVLPLIPIFAGLSALGTLAGGAAGIAKTINDYKSAQQNLQESNRHNKAMESLAIGKGLYIKPYKKGEGIFLRKQKN